MKNVRRFAKGLTLVLGFLFVAFLLPLDYAFSILLGCIAAMVVVLILRQPITLVEGLTTNKVIAPAPAQTSTQ